MNNFTVINSLPWMRRLQAWSPEQLGQQWTGNFNGGDHGVYTTELNSQLQLGFSPLHSHSSCSRWNQCQCKIKWQSWITQQRLSVTKPSSKPLWKKFSKHMYPFAFRLSWRWYKPRSEYEISFQHWNQEGIPRVERALTGQHTCGLRNCLWLLVWCPTCDNAEKIQN